jgi:hypothetical protein
LLEKAAIINLETEANFNEKELKQKKQKLEMDEQLID